MAVENTLCDGYISEKMMRAYCIQAIPIVVAQRVGERTLPD